MRVLVAHVSYRQRGGEDAVVEREIALLRAAGIDVVTLIVASADFDLLPAGTRAAIGLRLADHEYGRERMRLAIEAERPDVVHAHNLYPLLGIGALRVAHSVGIPTVHTWHNYRLSCIAGTHLYGGRTCGDCSVSDRVSGGLRGCYRGSRIQSLLYARAMSEQMKAFEEGVPDAVLCLTGFQRDWFIGQGLPASLLRLKPNSASTVSVLPYAARNGAVFVGRLSAEKGVAGLVRSWKGLAGPLTIVGSGPEESLVREVADENEAVTIRGELSAAETVAAMAHARVVVVPSLCFEALPMVVVEALAAGTPVLTFSGGSVAGIDSVTSVPHGDYGMFVERAGEFLGMPEPEWQAHSDSALETFRAQFSDERNTAELVRVYEHLIAEKGQGRREGQGR